MDKGVRMNILQIEGYEQFKCIGGACAYTCCRDWNVPVTEDKIELYKGAGYENVIRKEEDSHFIQMRDDSLCPLLTKDGWCDLVIKQGEEALCYTCTIFPRDHIKQGDLIEVSLSNACPEVVNLMRKLPGRFISNIKKIPI